MLPTDFPEMNKIYHKPEGMTDEECMELPVWQGKDQVGFPVIISKWRLSKEDMEQIQKTGCIWLSITGTGMPPVWIDSENPFS